MKIEFLTLYTSRLKEQQDFYEDVLGLPVKNVKDGSFQVEIGYSLLEFRQQDSATPYHFAVHIPPKQVEPAHDWLKERVEILKDEENEIVEFPAWKARSVYFYDADKNIVELISREDLFSAAEGFSEANFLGISEMGLATAEVEEKFRFLNDRFGLQKFSGDYSRFCATGDDEGLFIIINKEIKDWIPTGDAAFASPFEIEFSVKGASSRIAFYNDRLESI
ncbi:Catechol-2,3-dioxygenase [Salinimicrobium catena]|uniref:Catechol-2,3-dioxygenase n=1 Tax=Salinimicrobium catena TaxID=390640 RepID=A0A1H5L279_9FLAO|nr:glyoxalase [Salinimicrobium catena]SDL03928.1 Catechol-2,3-dioxygenase [Salinimicrobium catena]SEE70318.1 Catechol-2,3-dioxygenase [Salinimicrobium catena]